MKKSIVFILMVLGFTTGNAQIDHWDYGLNGHFNVTFIKPSVSDSLTNKSGFGGGPMVEFGRDKISIQLSPSYAYTSYINDNSLATTTIQSLDVGLDFMYALDLNRTAFLTAGITPAWTMEHVEKSLDGSKRSGVSSRRVTGTNRFDHAYKIGVSIKLNDGVRFNANYLDFHNGIQQDGLISGRADYLQFGLQFRFRERNVSTQVVQRLADDSIAIASAQKHVEYLTTGAPIIFVLPSLKDLTIRKMTSSEQDSFRMLRRADIESLILNRFNDRLIMIIHPEDLNTTLNMAQPFGNAVDPHPERWYYAQIGEFFLDNNANLKWGIFISDQNMDRLKKPFPYYIPYRNIDRHFDNESSTKQMIGEFYDLVTD